MAKMICIILWLVIALFFSLLLGKLIYKRCHYHLSFQLTVSNDAEENSRQKIKLTIKNRSIHKILIQEVGLFHKEKQEFYSFHKLIDHSNSLPTWIESNHEIQFIQYIVDLPKSFRSDLKSLVPYAKDSQGQTYF